jgi:hypothetical protein
MINTVSIQGSGSKDKGNAAKRRSCKTKIINNDIKESQNS